jgi:sugar phosphate isomerase/epimerase
MRLGGPLFQKFDNPDSWIDLLKKYDFSAAIYPFDNTQSDAINDAYAKAAEKAGIVIAEVGAWSNPISRDDKQRCQAIEYCKKQLELADRVGARCCVNIAGSRGARWDGPDRENLTADTFDLIVETVREIIDAVKPKRTFYTLETMPWVYPDSPESYVELIRAIDRDAFAVHLDPVNLICSPQRYFNNALLISDCFKQLGPYIKSCHAKDIRLSDHLTTHLDEVRPGLGILDYRVYLKEMNKLDRDLPLIVEHLETEEEYRHATGYIRSVAVESRITIL